MMEGIWSRGGRKGRWRGERRGGVVCTYNDAYTWLLYDLFV